MLDTVFYLVLNMSITASVIGLIIVVLRHIEQIPRAVVYALWSLVFIRLTFPYAISSEVSLLNLARGFIKRIVEVPLPELAQDKINLSLSNYVGAAQSYYPITYKNELLEKIFGTAAFVWVVGATAAILAVIILYHLTSSELRKSTHIKDNIYSSAMVEMPMVFGVFKQKIILPASLENNTDELKYVLLHEQVHIKRHDNLLRLLGVLTACIHWFNPFVWIFLKLFYYDMELSCDLKAVKLLTKDERGRYAKVLVNLSSGQKVFMSTAFGKTNVKVRVLNILSYRRLTVLAAVFSIFFIITIAVVLLTNPI